jgi:alkyl hydroperoxide reductase 1
VDVIAVIAYNDAHVMAAWGKANNIKGKDILFLSDTGNNFSKSYAWTNNERLARYAFIIDRGTVTYAAKDNQGEVDVSFSRFPISDSIFTNHQTNLIYCIIWTH